MHPQALVRTGKNGLPLREQMAGARMLHTMLRVRDLDASLAFYVDLLHMKLLRRKDFSEGEFTLAFVGYGDEETSAVLELTENWGPRDYELGTGYGHVAIGVADVAGATTALERAGARVTRPAGPLKGDPAEIIAFVEDPDGYRIELIERRTGATSAGSAGPAMPPHLRG